MTVEILRIAGMRGEHDRRALLAVLAVLPGVRRVVANLAERTVRIERDESASLPLILQALAAAGYEASVLV